MASFDEIKTDGDKYIIYCVAADQGRNTWHRISATSVVQSIKQNAILGEHIYISAGHILSSDQTYEILASNPVLLESGIVTVGLRDDCADMKTLAHQAIDKYQGKLDASDRKTISDRAIIIDNLCTNVVRWKPSVEQQLFKSSILASLTNPDSLLRRRLTTIGKADLNSFSKAIADMDVSIVSRGNLESCARKWIPRRTRAFMREANLLYYTIGAFDANLVPDLPSIYFDDMIKGVRESTYHSDIYSGKEVFSELMDVLVLPTNILDRLSFESIAELREFNWNELDAFREKWWKIMRTGDAQANSHRYDTKIVKELIYDAIYKERSRSETYEEANQVVGTASLFIALISLAPDPTIAALSFVVSLASYIASKSKVKSAIVKDHFHVLSTKLRRTALRR
jgi:hypothetical protein